MVTLATASGDDDLELALGFGVVLEPGIVEGKARGIDAEALPGLHLTLVGLLRNLLVEFERLQRMQWIGCEALGIDDWSGTRGERLRMRLDALAEAGGEADAGDDDVAGHGQAASGERPMAAMRLCIRVRISAGKGIRRKRSSASQIGLPASVIFALVAA
jgi:hypothetical protein